jgi:putative flippase GtrA
LINDTVKQGIRFLITGGFNTLITIAVYELMLFVVPAAAAYIIAWITGLIVTSIVYPLFVFCNRTITVNKSAVYSVYYIANFFFSLTVLEIIIQYEILSDRMAPILLLSIIVPLNFIASRFIFRESQLGNSSVK